MSKNKKAANKVLETKFHLEVESGQLFFVFFPNMFYFNCMQIYSNTVMLINLCSYNNKGNVNTSSNSHVVSFILNTVSSLSHTKVLWKLFMQINGIIERLEKV